MKKLQSQQEINRDYPLKRELEQENQKFKTPMKSKRIWNSKGFAIK